MKKARILFRYELFNGWKPQPHPGTQVTRCGCFLPDLTEFTSYCCGRTRASIDSVFLASLRSDEDYQVSLGGFQVKPPIKLTFSIQLLIE